MRKKRKTNSGLLGVSPSYCVTLPGDSLSCTSPPPSFLSLDVKKLPSSSLSHAKIPEDGQGFLMRKFSTTERTPTALKHTHEEAAYLAFLAERADAGRRDPVRHSCEDVEAHMEAVLAEHGA